jgi:hypothetical protein
VLEVHDSWLEVRIQPAWIARLFGARPLRAAREELEVFPARGFWGARLVGIRAGEREGYFACRGRQELLGRLQASGYRVTTTERKIVYF